MRIINTRLRVVNTTYLAAMLHHLSNTKHKYGIDDRRADTGALYVRYNNPDHKGRECPVYATLPVYYVPGEKAPRVILDCIATHGGRDFEDREVFEDSIMTMLDEMPDLRYEVGSGLFLAPVEGSTSA